MSSTTTVEAARTEYGRRLAELADADRLVDELTRSVDPDDVDALLNAEREAERARRRVELAERDVARAEAAVAAERAAAEEAVRAEAAAEADEFHAEFVRTARHLSAVMERLNQAARRAGRGQVYAHVPVTAVSQLRGYTESKFHREVGR